MTCIGNSGDIAP